MITFKDGMKSCSKCKKMKPFSEFDKCHGMAFDLYPSCKPCKREIKEVYRKNNPEKYREWKRNNYIRHRKIIIKKTSEYSKSHPEIRRKIMLKHQYGISEEFYNNLQDRQNGFCAICGIKPQRLYVDHCHYTKKIRGLLCLKCNSMLGFCNDNITTLNNAILYLSKE